MFFLSRKKVLLIFCNIIFTNLAQVSNSQIKNQECFNDNLFYTCVEKYPIYQSKIHNDRVGTNALMLDIQDAVSEFRYNELHLCKYAGGILLKFSYSLNTEGELIKLNIDLIKFLADRGANVDFNEMCSAFEIILKKHLHKWSPAILNNEKVLFKGSEIINIKFQ